MEPDPSPSQHVPDRGAETVSEAERARMARRIVEVGELSRFVLALRDAVRAQTDGPSER